MQPRLLWQDDSVLAIDKPAGWVVNRAETTRGQLTIQDWVEQQHLLHPSSTDDASDFAARSGTVHRLDKETSGVLLIARNSQGFTHLQHQFKSRQISKTYVCLVHGKLSPASGQIEVPVGRLPWNRKRHGVLPGGRPAVTAYEVGEYYQHLPEKSYYTLVKVYPHTGRTHQIRVHFKYLNHPLVGDSLYAGRKTARTDRTWCPRQFLHATRLTFIHPKTGKTVTVDSPLPSDLTQALQHLVKLATID